MNREYFLHRCNIALKKSSNWLEESILDFEQLYEELRQEVIDKEIETRYWKILFNIANDALGGNSLLAEMNEEELEEHYQQFRKNELKTFEESRFKKIAGEVFNMLPKRPRRYDYSSVNFGKLCSSCSKKHSIEGTNGLCETCYEWDKLQAQEDFNYLESNDHHTTDS